MLWIQYSDVTIYFWRNFVNLDHCAMPVWLVLASWTHVVEMMNNCRKMVIAPAHMGPNDQFFANCKAVISYQYIYFFTFCSNLLLNPFFTFLWLHCSQKPKSKDIMVLLIIFCAMPVWLLCYLHHFLPCQFKLMCFVYFHSRHEQTQKLIRFLKSSSFSMKHSNRDF